MFEDFTLKIKNITKDKAGKDEVKTLRKSIFEVAEAVEKFALNFSKWVRPWHSILFSFKVYSFATY